MFPAWPRRLTVILACALPAFAQAAREAGLAQPAHMIEHDMDIDGLTLDRPLVGEHLHAVDKLHDAVGLVANEPRQRAVIVGRGLFEKLGRIGVPTRVGSPSS